MSLACPTPSAIVVPLVEKPAGLSSIQEGIHKFQCINFVRIAIYITLRKKWKFNLFSFFIPLATPMPTSCEDGTIWRLAFVCTVVAFTIIILLQTLVILCLIKTKRKSNKQAAPIKNATGKQASTENTNEKQTSTEDANVRQSPTEDANVQQSPTEDANVQQSPTEDANVRQSPTENANEQQTSTEDANV